MVDFSTKDRIAEIKKIIAEQKSDEEELKALEEELKSKKEELEKKKEEVSEDKKKIDEILEDALEEESEDFKKSEKHFRRTNIQLNTPVRREETSSITERTKEETSDDAVKETTKQKPAVIYRQMNQVPNTDDMYQQLESLYKSVPQQNTRTSAQQQQRQVYHELKAMADKWGAAPSEQQRSDSSNSHYGREVSENPHSESGTWQRLSEKVKAMAEQAGNDEHQYQARTETVLNQIRHRFEDREYNIQDKKETK